MSASNSQSVIDAPHAVSLKRLHSQTLAGGSCCINRRSTDASGNSIKSRINRGLVSGFSRQRARAECIGPALTQATIIVLTVTISRSVYDDKSMN